MVPYLVFGIHIFNLATLVELELEAGNSIFKFWRELEDDRI